MCEKLHVLPEPGGMLDQDSYLIFLVRAVLEADAEKDAKEAKKQQAETAKAKAQASSTRRRR